jgi:hypothetical protein
MAIRIKPLPPIERLNELLEYDGVTGVIRWRVTRGRSAKAGDEAGSVNKETGYRIVMVDGRNYTASRIAWALHYGVDPYPTEVDHKNLNRTDNTIGNLRLATRAEQVDNRGHKGERPVRVTYPDGITHIIPSVTAAASLLNRDRPALYYYLRRPHTPMAGGITICYEL